MTAIVNWTSCRRVSVLLRVCYKGYSAGKVSRFVDNTDGLQSWRGNGPVGPWG